jgi:hypothetical protein
MPVRIIGMIGVSPPAREASLLVIEGAISPPFVVDFARAHEAAGFDMALVGYSSSSAEGFLVAMHAASQRHRQVAGSRLTMLAGRGRRWRGIQAAAATPLISAHVSNARALTARYWLAVTWSRGRWKRLLIWSWAERNRCA